MIYRELEGKCPNCHGNSLVEARVKSIVIGRDYIHNWDTFKSILGRRHQHYLLYPLLQKARGHD
jgi:hypothetical protein